MIAFILTLALLSQSALAYVGPGAGLQMIGSLIGLLSALGASLFFLILRPIIKRFKKHKKTNKSSKH